MFRNAFFRRGALLVALMVAGSCLLAGLADGQRAEATGSISLKGIALTPAIKNLDVHKGQATASFNIMVTNNTKNNVTLGISSVDFKSLNNGGGLAFVGNNAGQVDHKYGLARWLDIPGNVELKPNQTKPVPITVENRGDLSPGGHYAAVLFKVSGGGSGGNRVAFNQVVSTLVFVRKIDGEQYGIGLAKPSLPVSWLHLPTNIDLFFKNTGNVQAVPRGLVTISSPLSHEVARGIINTDSSLVLPESTRLIRTGLFNTGSAWLPGWYHVRVAYHYDGSSAMAFYDSSFLYLNLLSISFGLVALAVIWYIARQAGRLYRKWRHRRQRKQRPPAKRIEVQSD